jgi:hypothetical protein
VGLNLDVAGAVGISPGIAAATSGLDLSAAVTLVRPTDTQEFSHRCLGLTALVSAAWTRSAPREESVLVGPRWDAGDVHGTGYVRILGGVRRFSGIRAQSPGQPRFSDVSVAVGVGAGIEVIGFLLEVNWIASPWAAEASHRLSFSVGYTRSFRLGSRALPRERAPGTPR